MACSGGHAHEMDVGCLVGRDVTRLGVLGQSSGRVVMNEA